MSKRILILDDDPLVLRSIEMALKSDRYDCVCASTAETAIEQAHAQNFDLIISDIRMSGKNGMEAMSEIRSMFKKDGRKDIPIIFITGYSHDAVLMNAEGVGEIILKPFDLTRFLMTVREYL
ncbi:MAG: response regulator [Candidatus Omnitrophota bacterium]